MQVGTLFLSEKIKKQGKGFDKFEFLVYNIMVS